MYRLYGLLGSPYTLKLRAVLRYRRLPHIWVQVGEDDAVLERVRVPVFPVVGYPDGTFHNDTTMVIEDLERREGEARSVLPDDEEQAFICCLLEDMADEWATKAMFHYRWSHQRDQMQMSRWLAFDRLAGSGKAAIEAYAEAFRNRQVNRLAVVGATPENVLLIEETLRRVWIALEHHVTETPFLFGSRPSLADFGWYGQLSQVAIDPTPADLMRENAPYLMRWLLNLDDASGVEGAWWDASSPMPPAIRSLLELAGDVYLPFLKANASAVARGDTELSLTALGLPYQQGTSRYQVKCLARLRARFRDLSEGARGSLEPLLAETNCLTVLSERNEI